jgi:transposase-like protein
LSEGAANNQEASQNAQQAHLQGIPARKPRRSTKPPHVKAQVIAKRYVENKQIAEIARDTGMSRPTVYAILDEANLDGQIETGRKLSAGLIPQAIKVAEIRLAANSENMAIKVLENTIWPLNAKTSKTNDPSLTLAIQNLMLGPTQVNQPGTLHHNAAEQGTNAKAEIAQVTESTQDKP